MKYKVLKLAIFLIFIISIFFISIDNVYAANFSLEPTYIDVQGMNSSIENYTFTLKNETDNLVEVRGFVLNLTEDGDLIKESTMSNVYSTSLNKWFEFKRSTQKIYGGETLEVPVRFKINSQAPSGNYYARILFLQKSAMSEENVYEYWKENQDKVQSIFVTVKVKGNIVERGQLEKFRTKKYFNYEPPVTFQLDMKNLGNQDIKPKIEIRISDYKGEQIHQIDYLVDEAIAPKNDLTVELDWNPDVNLGKYKANAYVIYGEGKPTTIQDSFYFWYVDKEYVYYLLAALLLIIMLILIYVYSHRRRISQYINEVVDDFERRKPGLHRDDEKYLHREVVDIHYVDKKKTKKIKRRKRR